MRLRRIVRFCKFSAVAIIKNTNSVQQKKPPSRERGEWCDFANFKIFLYKKITNSVRARRVVICIFYLFCTARATAQNSAILQILGGCQKIQTRCNKKPPSRERGEWCDFANFKRVRERSVLDVRDRA